MDRSSFQAKWLLPGLLAISTFCADYFSKGWANSHLHYGDTQPFIPGLLRLTLTRNTGGAFGIGRGHGITMTLLALAIIAGIIIWMWKREHSDSPPGLLDRLGVGIILGGAFGNLFDRLTRGEVTDFLDFSFIDFPVFNVADALIDVGAAIIVLGALAFSKEKSEPATGKQSE